MSPVVTATLALSFASSWGTVVGFVGGWWSRGKARPPAVRVTRLHEPMPPVPPGNPDGSGY